MTLNGVTWDDSCTQQKNPENKAETKQAAVQRAWAGALELIDSAWTRFEQTHAILVKTQLDEADQKAINKHDPAYALFFAFDSSEAGRTKISNIISNLKSGANADLGTGPRPGEAKGHIHIGCQDTVESDGEDACERGPVFTESAEDSPSSHVNFCPDFWEKPRFDQLKTANSDDVYSWFYDPGFKGTDAKSVVHELTHFWWMGDTNSVTEEVYGVMDCAELAWECGPNPDNEEVVTNADSYGVYFEYGYFDAKGYSNMWDPSEEDEYPVRFPVTSW